MAPRPTFFERLAYGANRLAHAWNVFQEGEEQTTRQDHGQYGPGYSTRPDRRRSSISSERSIIASINTRIAMDGAAYDMKHVRLDDDGRYTDDIKSGLNNCLTVEANIDQAARAFKQDMILTMFEKGAMAVVPIDTSINPIMFGNYDINTMRVGEIVEWKARYVRVKLWNDRAGRFEEVTVPKSVTAIAENPLYQVMNEPNSTYQRLIRKLNILDAVDEASSSGKLDLIIQLPYVIKSEARKEQAEQRAKDIEMQLKGSKYGIAYTDGTEHITQLNRPAENNLMAQITYLTQQLYGQLGITEAVFDGSADDTAMLNYFNRTIEPVLTAITEAMRRTFLTKTARTQGQSILYFRDPFKQVAVKDFAEMADKFIRNQVFTANELRVGMGYKPSKDPSADKLMNPNMPQPAPASDTTSVDPNAPPNDGSTPLTATEQLQM